MPQGAVLTAEVGSVSGHFKILRHPISENSHHWFTGARNLHHRFNGSKIMNRHLQRCIIFKPSF
jgi:hypothetical protein